jgi:hypothetical protein
MAAAVTTMMVAAVTVLIEAVAAFNGNVSGRDREGGSILEGTLARK